MATTHGVVYVLELQCMAPQRALPPAEVRRLWAWRSGWGDLAACDKWCRTGFQERQVSVPALMLSGWDSLQEVRPGDFLKQSTNILIIKPSWRPGFCYARGASLLSSLKVTQAVSLPGTPLYAEGEASLFAWPSALTSKGGEEACLCPVYQFMGRYAWRWPMPGLCKLMWQYMKGYDYSREKDITLRLPALSPTWNFFSSSLTM